jgi:hypothetical protein
LENRREEILLIGSVGKALRLERDAGRLAAESLPVGSRAVSDAVGIPTEE